MTGDHDSENRIGGKRYVQLSLLVWIAMIGIDFFLHGGIFAAMYLQDSPFLLSNMEAFRRIPLGYLALLVTAGLIVWIIERASARGWRKGLVVGLGLGAVMGLSSSIGLFSIITASPQFLAASFVAQVVEMAAAGALIGQGLMIHSLRRLTLIVVIGFVVLLVGTIVLQNTGLAPSLIAT